MCDYTLVQAIKKTAVLMGVCMGMLREMMLRVMTMGRMVFMMVFMVMVSMVAVDPPCLCGQRWSQRG